MKKYLYIALSLLLVLLTGCAKAQNEDADSNLTIKKDNSIVYSISEDFKENYYSLEELNGMIDDDVKGYNANHPDAINYKPASLNEQTVTLEMTFSSCEDYAAFNNEVLFLGTPAEAMLKGYDLDTILTDVNDPTKTIAGVDIKSMTDNTILITDFSKNIHLPSEALYISDSAGAFDKNRTVRKKETATDAVFVIY